MFLQVYDGAQFYGEELYEDADITSIELCDRAFVSEDFGLSVQVLDGERVLTVGSTQVGVREGERMNRQEAIDRLVEVVRGITDC